MSLSEDEIIEDSEQYEEESDIDEDESSSEVQIDIDDDSEEDDNEFDSDSDDSSIDENDDDEDDDEDDKDIVIDTDFDIPTEKELTKIILESENYDKIEEFDSKSVLMFPKQPYESENNYKKRIALEYLIKNSNLGLSPLTCSICSFMLMKKMIFNLSYEKKLEDVLQKVLENV